MPRVGLLHTVPALADEFEPRVARDGVQAVHIADPSLLADAISGGVDPALEQRVQQRIDELIEQGVDAVLVTCSSIGEAVELAASSARVPVLRVDAPMARQAVDLAAAGSGRIAVLATLAATLGPTGRLLDREAEGRAVEGRDIEVRAELVEDAAEARSSGDQARHDRLIAEAVRRAATGSTPADVIVLAQASMAAAAASVDVDVPVLTSPAGGARSLLDAVGVRS